MTLPIVEDVRWAAGAVRTAIDTAMAGEAPVSACTECGAPFYFLAAGGFVAHDGLCPKCEPEVYSTDGLALDPLALDRAVFDRRGLLSLASSVVAERGCTMEDAVFYLERVEVKEDAFKRMLALARRVAVAPVDVWRAAYLCWTLGLGVAAASDPVAAAMARMAAAMRPDSVVRCVVKARGRTLYDGPVVEACGRAIRDGERDHGRKLMVTLHMTDGTKIHRRGERDTAPENRFDDAALGGVRAMMAERTTVESVRVASLAMAKIAEENPWPGHVMVHPENAKRFGLNDVEGA